MTEVRSRSVERDPESGDLEPERPRPAPPAPAAADDRMERWKKIVFCFLGLQFSYVIWGITQENLMTTVYSFGKFKSSNFCVFANRLLALIIASLVVFTRKYLNSHPKSETKAAKEMPFYYYAPASISNTLSSWAQYEALKYVSFPMQVLSKSCKIIPVMLVKDHSIVFLYSFVNFFLLLFATTSIGGYLTQWHFFSCLRVCRSDFDYHRCRHFQLRTAREL
jgi:hypothetical protein